MQKRNEGSQEGQDVLPEEAKEAIRQGRRPRDDPDILSKYGLRNTTAQG
jgi:hypothetical protein